MERRIVNLLAAKVVVFPLGNAGELVLRLVLVEVGVWN